LRRPVLLLALACFAFSPMAEAVTPPPDGGYPNKNTAEGEEALFRLSLGSGSGNTAIGFHALHDSQDGLGNTAIGSEALERNTANYNTATGRGALSFNTTGFANTALGNGALENNTNGGYNTATGVSALRANTASENTAYGAFALTLNTTGKQNTASGFQALGNNVTGFSNTATGYNALSSNTSGVGNAADGNFALYKNTTGGNNTAMGNFALLSNTIGNYNTASGSTALEFNSTGNSNTAFGNSALLNNTTGSLNVALGNNAASNLTTGSNNIVIGAGVLGAAGDANKIRIGKSTHAATYIGGIYNKTIASGSGVGVMIDANGKLGTVVSSARFKEAIKPMHKASEAILALEPVTFRYKHELDPDGLPQFGLIAEQVEKVDANLVVRGEDGKVNTVRYEAVNAMLLNEFLKEHRKVEEQQATITRLASRLAKQELTGAQQQKQIEALTATVQKVSDQIALSKPAPQLVTNP
jgi:uncharacterized coiled-coil protein SlyX